MKEDSTTGGITYAEQLYEVGETLYGGLEDQQIGEWLIDVIGTTMSMCTLVTAAAYTATCTAVCTPSSDPPSATHHTLYATHQPTPTTHLLTLITAGICATYTRCW